MVYYIKAMAKGAAKLALPFAFAATALTPAMAADGTTLKLVGPQKMAIGQSQEVFLVMDNKVEDLSIVEFKLLMPPYGLKYVDKSFELVGENLPEDYVYKMEPTDDGYRVGIYHPHQLKKIGVTTHEGGDTIAKFKIYATNYLTESPQGIGLKIVDLTRSNTEQIPYDNIGKKYIIDEETGDTLHVEPMEGGEGDNSIGLAPVEEDRDIMPGDWTVSVPGQTNKFGPNASDSTLTIADSTLTLVPNDTVYRKQHFEVNLLNKGNKIGGLSFDLNVPQGVSIDPTTLKANKARTLEKAVNYEVIKDAEGNPTNDYHVTIMGTTQAIEGEDGLLLSFDASVDQIDMELPLDQHALAEDEFTMSNITVTSIFNTQLSQDDIKFVVKNLNRAAYDRVLADFIGKDTWAQGDTINRIYDYPEVLAKREAAKKFMTETYVAGAMHLNNNEDAAKALNKAYKDEVVKLWETNRDLFKEYTNVIVPALAEELADVIPEGVTYPILHARSAKDELTVDDFINPEVAEKYAAADKAIGDLETKVINLWNAKDSVKLEGATPEQYDGELLSDIEEVLALKQAADDAIKAFENTLIDVNDDTAQELKDLVSGDTDNEDLADLLAAAEDYVASLSPESKELTNVFNKPGNFPEIEQAVADAQDAIDAVSAVIDEYQNKEWLPFAEGIEPVLNAIAEANEAIENVKTVADQMKKENDDAYAAGLEKYDDLVDQLPVAIEDTLQNTQTYKDAMADVEKAIEDYKSLLEHDDSLGLCDKDSTALKEKYEAAVAELEAAQDIIDDLVELNGMIDLNNQDLAEAEDELQRIIDDYKYMEDGEKTKDLIDAIKQKIEDLHNAIDELTEEINSADDWKDLNDPDKVQEWKDRLNDINGQINGVENPETGELEGGLDQDIENAEETYIKYHKQGDANMDGDIDPTDYAEIIEYVLENKDIKKVTQERYDQLNVIPQDGNKVTIADATAVINLYYYGDVNGLPSARTISDAVESLTAETSLVNGTHRTALSLSNANSYVAAQMDVVVPEGMKVTGVKLSGRNGSHDLLTNTLADGTLRIVVSSMENVAFSGNEGAVLYIETEGAGTLEYRDVMFVTAGAEPVEFTVGAAETTGISSVKSAEGVKEAVYNLGGRLVNTLKKGVNIIRRANGTTDKVVMK